MTMLTPATSMGLGKRKRNSSALAMELRLCALHVIK